MKLDRDNGIVVFEQGSIGPETTRQSFLGSLLGKAADVLIDNEPYLTYRIRPEPGVAVALSFESQSLRSISWLFELTVDKEKEWAEQLELERKQIHDEWLFRELGPPPYRFGWGELSSQYDPKGCVSDIILSYAV